MSYCIECIEFHTVNQTLRCYWLLPLSSENFTKAIWAFCFYIKYLINLENPVGIYNIIFKSIFSHLKLVEYVSYALWFSTKYKTVLFDLQTLPNCIYENVTLTSFEVLKGFNKRKINHIISKCWCAFWNTILCSLFNT